MNKIVGHVLVVMLSASFLTYAAERSALTVPNSGFEDSGLTGWQVSGPAERVTTDAEAPHAGQISLKIFHLQASRTSVFSEPVSLRVGHFYRLRAWVRTADAFTNPADRYPTPVAACLTMESFLFTNHSPAAGATSAWHEIEILFIAAQASDRVGLHLGFNGAASGTAWFDDVCLEEVNDITRVVAPETLQRHGPAFRFTDRGWVFLHIEGKPYARGYQHGYLMAEEMAAFMEKLAVLQNIAAPAHGWSGLRLLADSLMLRQFEEEYLLEMRGMADGMNASKVNMKHKTGPIDLLDIVTVNSAIDLGQLNSALAKTATPVSGRSFPPSGEEEIPDRLHKCSAILANHSATVNGGLVFFQMFMWNGYTGVQFNVICDVVPEKGRRLVYETFPGGIHSGTDFYINDAGIMIGETTTQQTPFDSTGRPQSDRIRKAAQYAASIDDVVRILTTRNNGLYTNDWLIGDARANEIAVLLLGTKKFKLWRSRNHDFPGNTTDFYWCVNNARDPEVRKEFVPDPQNSPFDLTFSPSNRDIAMVNFFQQKRGQIDVKAAIDLMASSPINRPHACDGKVTSGEMAKEMVFMAHFGKTTLREKFPGETPRLPLLPDAIPHLTLGYSLFSPKVVTAKIQALRAPVAETRGHMATDMTSIPGLYAFANESLWSHTVYPASEKENWFVSATAAYHNLLKRLPPESVAAATFLHDSLAEMNSRLLFLTQTEGGLVPLQAQRKYDRYNHYQIPRIRGTYLLHQLRLALGNEVFSRFMKEIHDRFQSKPLTQAQFNEALKKISSVPGLQEVAAQWLQRQDLPAPIVTAKTMPMPGSNKWKVAVEVIQPADAPFHFWTTIRVDLEKSSVWKLIEVQGQHQQVEWVLADSPRQLVFNAGGDIPVPCERFYTHTNFTDNFASTRVVYGTCREIEAFHTLGLRFCTVLADAFSEVLPPLHKDSEISPSDLENSNLILLGGAEDNLLTKEVAIKLGMTLGKNWFSWNHQVYGHESDGLLAVFPSPFNPRRTVTLLIANSALQLYQMTKAYQPLPSWALFRGDKVVGQGYHQSEAFTIAFPDPK